MNVANLQMEGLLMACASINKILVQKGVMTVEEIDLALRKAEASVTSDDRVSDVLSPSNRDAICFPIRLLQLANSSAGNVDGCSFGDLAKMVGRTKGPYNDQL